MKSYHITLFITIFFLTISQNTEAQFLKKMQKNVEDKFNNEAESRSKSKTDKSIDNLFDKAENVLDKKFGKKNKNTTTTNNDASNTNNSNSDGERNTKTTNQANVVWSKFDFIPGDQVIFEDGPSADEENGEFPSRWDLVNGNAEIGEVDGEYVIMFLGGGKIVPYLKDSEKDNLPEIFTIEFDVYFKEESPGRYWIRFYDYKNQHNKIDNLVTTDLEVYVNGLEFGDSNKRYPDTDNLNWNENHEGKWRHISIAYTKGKFKAYMDDTRLINIPHLKGNPSGLTISAENNSINQKFLKNIRIAKGGVKYYDRVLSEGKIIVNGIKFDVNKATLKPESIGPINKIYQLMENNPELNFSVEGHTDSDGAEDANLKLSKARGKTVMDKLISMGISSDRLKSTGFGESKPIDSNATPEGKANNRRVEFVKF